MSGITLGCSKNDMVDISFNNFSFSSDEDSAAMKGTSGANTKCKLLTKLITANQVHILCYAIRLFQQHLILNRGHLTLG